MATQPNTHSHMEADVSDRMSHRVATLVSSETKMLRAMTSAWECLQRLLMANPYLDTATREEISRVRAELGAEIKRVQTGKS